MDDATKVARSLREHGRGTLAQRNRNPPSSRCVRPPNLEPRPRPVKPLLQLGAIAVLGALRQQVHIHVLTIALRLQVGLLHIDAYSVARISWIFSSLAAARGTYLPKSFRMRFRRASLCVCWLPPKSSDLHPRHRSNYPVLLQVAPLDAHASWRASSNLLLRRRRHIPMDDTVKHSNPHSPEGQCQLRPVQGHLLRQGLKLQVMLEARHVRARLSARPRHRGQQRLKRDGAGLQSCCQRASPANSNCRCTPRPSAGSCRREPPSRSPRSTNTCPFKQ